MKTVVIVGSSLAGLRAAETLRLEKYEDRIVIVGAERHQPYDRPPLSKKVLLGEWEAERISLRKAEDLDKLNVEWKLGSPAQSLDTEKRILTLSTGEEISYDGLIIATGSVVRRLTDEPDWKGIHVVRTLDDSLALRAELNPGTKVVVIGAGFIGLEVAATARARGCEVVVLEGAAAPMMRGLGAEMGHAAAMVHGDNGVTMAFNVRVTGLAQGQPGHVGGVNVQDGPMIVADVVVVGIGVSPATQWLDGTSLILRDGVVCDETLNSGIEGVYAAGDVCRWYNNLYDKEMRVEHWTTASEQGAAAASNLLAVWRGEKAKPYSAVPFFWSDQFTARIQFLGRCDGDETPHIVVGSPEERSFVALYEKDGLLKAALGVSRPRQLMPFRKLLSERATFAEAMELVATFVAS